MLAMLERFLRLEKCVRSALMAAGSSVSFTDQDITVLKNLCAALKPAKSAVDRLNQRDATLLSAERINNIVFERLEAASEKNPFAGTFMDILKVKLEARRPADVIHLMEYLNDPSYVKSTTVDPFGIKPKKAKIRELATELLRRLFSVEDTDENQNPEVNKGPGEVEIVLSMEQEMDIAHQSVKKDPGPTTVPCTVSKKSLKKELDMFETSSVRTQTLDALLDALNTIKPSSVESERHGILQ